MAVRLSTMDTNGQQFSFGTSSPESYRLLFEANPNPMFVFDIESFQFLAVNEAALKLYGYSRDEFLGMTAKEIRSSEDVDLFVKTARGMKGAVAAFVGSFHHRKKDGTLIDVEISVSEIAFSGRMAQLVVVHDVTERQRSERRFRAMLEKSGELITLVDKDGIIILDSPNVEVWLGYETGELKGTNCFDLIHPEDLGGAIPVFKELVRQPGMTQHVEVRMRTKSGAWRWFLTFGTNLLEDEAVGGVVLNSRDVTARREAEDELRASEERLRAIVENTTEVVYRRNVEIDRYDYVSPVATQVLGFDATEMQEMSLDAVLKRIHPDDVPAVRKALAQVEATSRGAVEYRFKCKNGQYRWLADRFTIQKDARGQVMSVTGTMRDATERKRAEEALRASEERWRALMDNLPAPVQGYGTDGIVTYWNRASERVYGYAAAEAIGRKLSDLIVPPELQDGCRQALALGQRMTQSGEFMPAGELSLLRKDGSRVLVHSTHTAVCGPDGSHQLFCLDLDLTERQRIEEALRVSEAHYRLLADNADDFISLEDAEGNHLYVSPSYRRVTGWTPEEMVTSNWRTRMHPEDLPDIERVKAAVATGETVTFEHRIRCRDGSWIWVVQHCKPILDADGKVQQVMLWANNITERKQAEEMLKKSQRLLAETEKIGKVGGWEFNIETKKQTWTEEVYRIHEVDLDFEPTVENGIKFYTPASRPIITAAVQRTIESGEPFDVELEIITAKGNFRSVHAVGKADLEQRRVYGFFQDITERKQVEEALRESEERYRVLFQGAPGGIIVVDVETQRFNYANPAICRMLGYTAEELTQLEVKQIHPQESLQRVVEEFAAQARDEKTLSADMPCLRKDGTIFYADISGALLSIGGRKMLIGFLNDITERKNAETKLRESEKRYRLMINAIPQMAWRCDAAGATTDVNRRWLDYTGLTFEESMGDSWIKVVHPDDAGRAMQKFQDDKDGGEIYQNEYRLRRADGVYRWHLSRAVPLKDPTGQIVAWFGTVTDLDDQKRAEQVLRESEGRFRHLAEAMPQGVWIRKLDGESEYINQWFLDYIGMTQPLTLQEGLKRVVYPDDLAGVRAAWERAVASETDYRAEFRARRFDGQYRWFLSHAVPIRDAAGHVVKWFGTSTDIDDRKQVEAILIRSQQELEAIVRERTDELRKEMLQRLHLEQQILEISEREKRRIGQDLHDGLGQELAGIGFLASSLRGKLAKISREDAANVARISKLLSGAIQQVRALSRGLHPVKADPEALMSALTELAGSVRKLQGIACSFKCPRPVRVHDQHVATNLYRIAQEAVHNALRHGRPKRIWLSLTQDDGALTLEVRDNGSGIKKRRRSHKGIGLEIMRYRATIMGASCSVEPGPRRGTVVRCIWQKPSHSNKGTKYGEK